MSNHVRWGVLGAARFAREHMAPAIHSARGGTFDALATRAVAKAQGFSVICPDLRLHADYEAMLADPDIDAVYIPLPNHLHIDWTLRCLNAGKHVLCEKPMTMLADDFDRLIAARNETGLLAAEAFMIVHHPQWQQVRTMVSGGVIGRLVHVEGRFSYDNRSDPGNIRNRAETGGGALRDIGVYVFGSARFVSGEEPEDLTAQIRWEGGVDVFAQVQARFPSFTYAAYVSMRMHPYQEMIFHGEAGLIRLTAPFNAGVFGEARIELHKPGLQVDSIRFPAANHYVLQVEAFNRSVTEGMLYPCPLEFSRGTQMMIDRAFQVAQPL